MTKLYASGEEPRVGDVVRTSAQLLCAGIPVTPGDVFEARLAGCDVELKLHGEYLPNGGWLLKHFTLIARAGDPVTFQPGDVVEGVADALNGAILKGARYTLDNTATPSPAFIDSFGLPRSAHVSAKYVTPNLRLVHRPDASAAVEPAPVPTFSVGDRVKSKRTGREYQVLRVDGERIEVPGFPGTWEFDRFTLVEPAPTTAEIVATLRHGDRARFVIEATCDMSDSEPTSPDGWWLFADRDILAGTIEILSRAAPTPSVGKLSSTDDLLPGDILVCTTPGLGLFGEQVTVKRVDSASLVQTSEGLYHPSHFAFVRRPVS